MSRQTKPRFLKKLIPQALCILISLDGLLPAVFAQNPENLPAHITLTVVEGEGATAKTRQHPVHDPVVKVEDDDHRPVAEAAVVFALPVSGTSGEFANGSKTLTVVTDKDGLAAARGLRANDVPGKLQIYVNASYHGLRARILINQVVEAEPGAKTRTPDLNTAKSSNKWKWILLGAAAVGGAGAGVYFASRNSSSTPISISTGTVAFGSPR
jgi:hypothetical protein